MNRLIILGNGFDLAHGLKTSYREFLIDLIKQRLKPRFNDEVMEIQASGDLRLRKIEEQIDSEMSLNDLKSFLEHWRIDLKWKNELLREIYHNQPNKWVDIEMIYYKSLKIYFKLNDLERVKKINQDLEQIKLLLSEYLRKKVVPIIEYNSREGNRNVLENLVSPFLEIFRSNDGRGKTLFLNFNYTDLIQLYQPFLGHEFDTVNIHGTLFDPKSIVFGFGDELDLIYQEMEDFNDNMLLEHVKSFKYLQYPAYSRLEYFLNESEEFGILIFGHSCGLSDRTLLNHILEHDDCSHIAIYPFDENDFITKSFEISRHFKSKNKMRDRIINNSLSHTCPQVKLEAVK